MEKDMSILELVVKTKTAEYNVDLAADLKINQTNINQDFCEQPAKFAWWATVAVQAQSLADAKKMEVERQEDYIKKTLMGELDTLVRQDLEMSGEKITESRVTNRIYAHRRYKTETEKLNQLQDELLELQHQAAILAVARESMVQRKDALISLGANMRTETGNVVDLSIKANEIIANSRKSRVGKNT